MKTLGVILVAVALALTGGCAKPDWIGRTLVTVDVTGTWYGKTVYGRGITELSLDLQQAGSKVKGSMNSFGISVPIPRNSGTIEGTIAGDVFSFRQTNGPLTGEMTVDGDEMTGQVSVSSIPTPIVLRRTAPAPKPDSEGREPKG